MDNEQRCDITSEVKIERVRGGFILEYWLGPQRVREIFASESDLLVRLAETIKYMSVPA